jgi:hypothetical protein
LGEWVESEREALKQAWEAARALVAAMPDEVGVAETAGR